MRKHLLSVSMVVVAAIGGHAQVGIGTTTPNRHAVLELKSPGNNQGLLAPSVTTAQRTAASFTASLGAQENGLLVYDTDLKTFFYWMGNVWQPILSGSPAGGGTVTNIATGIGLSGGPITTTGTISLANTAVAPATYGDATHVSQLVVDAQGRITNASNVVIAGVPPSGAAGGDLTGTYPAPTVTANAITTAKILDGTIATADLAALAVTDAKIAAGITPSKVNPSVTNGQVLTTVAGTTAWATPAAGGSVTSVATTARLTGGPITTSGTLDLAASGVTASTYGSGTQVAQFTVDIYGRITTASNVTITGAPPNGAAGGDLTGTYPNPTIGTGKVTSTAILDATILNADINAAAGIQDTKLATIVTAGKVSGNAITSGTITGTTAMSTAGSIVTTNSITASNALAAGSVITSTNSSTGTAISGTTSSVNGNQGVYGQGSGVTVGRTVTYSYGVYGANTYSGAYGYLGAGYGAYGNNAAGDGVHGDGYYGVFGVGSYIGVLGSCPNVAGNYGVYSNGQAGGTTTWAAVSDMRFKKNIKLLSNSLDKILRLRGVSYDWRVGEFPAKHFGENHEIGVIAQEIKEVLPEVVVQDREGYYSVSYEKIVPVLVEAVKEQQRLIEIQNQKIAQLEKGLSDSENLKSRMATLESLLLNHSESKKSASIKSVK